MVYYGLTVGEWEGGGNLWLLSQLLQRGWGGGVICLTLPVQTIYRCTVQTELMYNLHTWNWAVEWSRFQRWFLILYIWRWLSECSCGGYSAGLLMCTWLMLFSAIRWYIGLPCSVFVCMQTHFFCENISSLCLDFITLVPKYMLIKIS